jgi:mediator of RNA polymerase II transcription subunit 14
MDMNEQVNGPLNTNTDDTTLTTNGFHPEDNAAPTDEELEGELPVVFDGQVPLGELLERVVQGIYAELVELAETLVTSHIK